MFHCVEGRGELEAFKDNYEFKKSGGRGENFPTGAKEGGRSLRAYS